MAPRVASQQPPAGQDESAEYAESRDRLRGVFRARRVVLARARRRTARSAVGRAWIGSTNDRPASVTLHRSTGPHGELGAPTRTSRLVDQFAERTQRIPARPSRSARARASGRATTTASVPAGRRAPRSANASRRSRLTRLRSTAPPTFRETDSPRRGGRARRRAGTRTGRARGRRASGRCRKTRSKSALRDSLPRREATGSAADDRPVVRAHQTVRRLRPLSRRRFSVSRPARVLHPRTETVRARALALLRLIGAFHGSRRPEAGREPVYARAASRDRRDTRRRDVASALPRGLFLALCANAPGDAPTAQMAAGIFARPGALAPGLTNRSPERSEKEPLGAACATRARPCLARDPRRAPPCRRRSTYEIWLAPLEVEGVGRDGRCSSRRRRTPQAWVAKRFGRILEACARAVVGPAARIAFAGDRASRPPTGPRRADTRARATPTLQLQPPLQLRAVHHRRRQSARPRRRAGGRRAPGQAYNPLFLHAPPGLGKTHLLHAIGNYVLAFGGGATVRYTTVEAFTNHFISALGIAVGRTASSTRIATPTCC